MLALESLPCDPLTWSLGQIQDYRDRAVWVRRQPVSKVETRTVAFGGKPSTTGLRIGLVSQLGHAGPTGCGKGGVIPASECILIEMSKQESGESVNRWKQELV